MNIVFYLSAVVAIAATLMVITRDNAMHALLYLIVSLLSVALVFFSLGAPFVAALEVIVYAGAIMVLFIFAIMLLNQGPQSAEQERRWMRETGFLSGWLGPAILALVLLGELVFVLAGAPTAAAPGATAGVVPPRLVGASLFTTYLVGVELASVLLLASLVGAYHLGRRHQLTRNVQRQEARIARQKELKVPFQELVGGEQPAGDDTPETYAVGKEHS